MISNGDIATLVASPGTNIENNSHLVAVTVEVVPSPEEEELLDGQLGVRCQDIVPHQAHCLIFLGIPSILGIIYSIPAIKWMAVFGVLHAKPMK